jgi:hypothetical protein
MAESELHKRLKIAMGQVLFDMGYQSGVVVGNGNGGINIKMPCHRFLYRWYYVAYS